MVNGCRKNEFINDQERIESSMANVKSDFLSKPEYQKKLYQPLFDTMQIYWQPAWGGIMHKVQDDSITWYYVPLSPEVRNKQDKQLSHQITMNNIKKYIIARSTDAGISFSLGSYIVDRKESETPEEPDSFNEAFTGQLMQENFEGGPVYLKEYKQGNPAKISNKARVANTKSNSSVPNTLSSTTGETVCTYQSICQWSGVGIDNTPHITVTSGNWNSTQLTDCPYPIRTSPTGPTTWTRNYSYFDQRCEVIYDPPTGPPLPPGTGGGGGGTTPQRPEQDSELTTYEWRDKLGEVGGEDKYLAKTTPQYITDPVTGKLIPNPEAYNCHFHAFGPNYVKTMAAEGLPKWAVTISMGTDWTEVTGEVKVGDRVLYFNPDPSKGVAKGLTHSAIVTAINDKAQATMVSSKMGEYQILNHHPKDIPSDLGQSNPTYTYYGTTYPSRVYYRKK